jgi:hypothetical protein
LRFCYGGPGKKSPDYSAFGQITGLALVSYRLLTPHGWQGNVPFRV